MIAYAQPTKGGFPKAVYARSENGSTVPLISGFMSPRKPQSIQNRSMIPTSRRTSGKLQQDRSEYMLSYPQTPPRSGGSTSSSPSPKGQKTVTRRQSTSLRRMSNPLDTIDASNMSKDVSSTAVELILSSCDPSLIHIAPILAELGIHRMEHLRAIARLSEETRDREIKEQALKRGVTVMEWAILLDKLQDL